MGRTVTLPTTGYFGGGSITLRREHVYVCPITQSLNPPFCGLEALPLKTQAIRTLDRLQHGSTMITNEPVARWLELRGYVRRVALEVSNPLFSEWVFEVTESGRQFHRLHAAPVGEW